MKWEYFIHQEDIEIPVRYHLDDLGKDGWDLVSVIPIHETCARYIFKRPVQEEQVENSKDIHDKACKTPFGIA